MLETYALFYLCFCTSIQQSLNSMALGTTLSFLPLLPLGEKIENKICKWCVPRFVVYLEFSRIKRLVWRNLSGKSNISSNDKSSIHYPILYSYVAGGKKWELAGQFMPFLNLCIFLFKGYGSPFHLALVRIPWVCHCHLGESPLPWGGSSC